MKRLLVLALLALAGCPKGTPPSCPAGQTATSIGCVTPTTP